MPVRTPGAPAATGVISHNEVEMLIVDKIVDRSASTLLDFDSTAYRTQLDEVANYDHRPLGWSYSRGYPPWPGHVASASATAQRTNSLTLAAVPSAVSCARLFVGNVLRQWGFAHLVDTAELLTSELVTNSVKTTGITDPSPRSALLGEVHLIQVQLVLAADDLVIGVWDRDRRPPVLREPDLDAEGGRGMFLIESMSRRWGCDHPTTGGKVVWFELGTAVRTTASGLPIRTPNRVPAGRVEIADELVLLQRVVERLRRLQ